MREADLGVLQPWYTDKAAMRGTARRNTKLLLTLIEKCPFHGYFTETENNWHICAEGREEEEA